VAFSALPFLCLSPRQKGGENQQKEGRKEGEEEEEEEEEKSRFHGDPTNFQI
jgi:ribosomal protein L12E/L44/L45/RPP1/RPP2